ncbi:PREDICTED: rho GTPase-activating protein gacO-like isoform X3 [Populus euphratica]|uniref:Rho GTPase-activating protein gacO-like isoform X3 n=1 Tax=Populus euphratica TaxID=75702 RepID=A0AAJ6UKB6_POPEU|nr:PREDICTED: rho GTPase-activating protein gacO-like isoform X3 [Populus euphratica]
MDSSNSGSMQSSSGGDEEYDSSRAESISAFFNSNNNKNNPFSHVRPMPSNQPPEPDHHHHQSHHSSSSSTMFFDPFSNYFDPLVPSSSSSRSPLQSLTNPNSLHNLDMVWSKNLRSDPNCTDLGGFISSSLPTQQFTTQTQNRTTFQSLPSHGQESATRVPGSGSVSGTNDKVSNTAGIRKPKKRSRASRRAPTTVLSTDTTNFRAMVQEFTGIPAPPFTSSPFPRSRLDLFGTAASALRSPVSHHLDPSPPPYLLGPFAKTFQPPPPPAPPFVPSGSAASSFSASMVDAIASTTTTNIKGTCTNTTTSNNIPLTSINYQLPSDLGLLKQPHNLLNPNVQNPIHNFHPLLQAPPKYPLPDSPNILGTTKPQQGSLEIPLNVSHLKMVVLEEFGLNHGHVNTNLSGLQNIVSSSSPSADVTLVRRRDHSDSLTNWGDGAGSNEVDHHHHQQQGLLRSINGDYNNSTQRVTNGKVNFLASSSDFCGDHKLGQENAATRSEVDHYKESVA